MYSKNLESYTLTNRESIQEGESVGSIIGTFDAKPQNAPIQGTVIKMQDLMDKAEESRRQTIEKRRSPLIVKKKNVYTPSLIYLD
jgi:hypothetical protein